MNSARELNIRIPKGVRYIIGIDEVGRGPIAGPVTVGAVVIKRKKTKDRRGTPGNHRGIDDFLAGDSWDSKGFGRQRREEKFNEIRAMAERGGLVYVTSSVAASVIDKKGIVPAIDLSIARSLLKTQKLLGNRVSKSACLVLLDGSLKVSAEYKHQVTIVKGDKKVPIIGMASIAAKVTRDRYMARKARLYPEYGWDQNAGYGTAAHYEAIKKGGLTELHRQTFLT